MGRTLKGATMAIGIIFLFLLGGSPLVGDPDSELETDGNRGEDMFTPQKPCIA